MRTTFRTLFEQASRHAGKTLLTLALTAAGASPAQAFDSSNSFVIENAKLHVGDTTVLDDADIVVRDGKIVKVTANSKATTPGAIDAGGKHVTPGLISVSSALGLVEISMESSTRDDEYDGHGSIRAGYDPAPAIFAESSLLAIQATSGITSAAVSPGGALLSGAITWIDLLHGDHAELVARRKIGIAGNLGQSHGGSRAASLQHLRAALEDARFLRRSGAAFDRGQSRRLMAPASDLRALYPVLDRKIPLSLSAHRASDLLAIAQFAREQRVEVIIVGATEGWKVADELAAAKIPVVIQPTHNLPGGFDRLGARLDNAALLHAAGVKLMIAEIGSAHNARNMTQEAGIAVANGLPYEVALSALTLEVARAHGMDATYGSVARGKVANLVIWTDDPFELSGVPERVFIRGRAHPMRSRQTLLRDRYMDLAKYRP